MPEDAPTPGDAEWSQWMRLAQAGDDAAYQRLLKAVAPSVATIARSFIAQPDAADDAVQDILLIVHSVRHAYEADRPFKPWLATIARRRCIDVYRQRQRRAPRRRRCEPARCRTC